jgi:hypothetical protein
VTWKLASRFYEDGLPGGVPSARPVRVLPQYVYWELNVGSRSEHWMESGNKGIEERKRFEFVSDAVFAFVDAAAKGCEYRLVRADGVPLLRVERKSKRRFRLHALQTTH